MVLVWSQNSFQFSFYCAVAMALQSVLLSRTLEARWPLSFHVTITTPGPQQKGWDYRQLSNFCVGTGTQILMLQACHPLRRLLSSRFKLLLVK